MLENPVWAALSGPQACFAEASGDAARYQPDVSPFCAVADFDDPAAWADLAELTDKAFLTGPKITPPDGWEPHRVVTGAQMVGHGMTGVPDEEAVVLGETDVPEILDLVERAQPGPFGKRTVELGRYLGLRHEGRLVAMAGERLQTPGWTEVSAVCTDPAFRGRGLGARLTMAVAAGILDRGDLPFLHVTAENEGAIRLYERLGFQVSHQVQFASFTRRAHPRGPA
ncbi:GNAT family N-acetyltransferase [Actinoplanes sp. NPDC049596]|uniref:GNAT family N-acetyltransferase n=1 Tax=unclassified Actinoplanes TaxID=2626549 RepID=UPI00344791DE